MSRYAEKTDVAVTTSRAEIERIISRYGADEFVSGWKAGRAVIQFRIRERVVRFVLPLPDKAERQFTHCKRGRSSWETPRTEDAALGAWEQACRQRWRALALTIKAKLESQESGIEEFDSAFMAQIVLPNGQTVAEAMLPQIALAYERNEMPPMLEYGGAR